jgi:sigma-B regulation protein RsbU (phosphoserine phosphatase)
VTGDEDLLEDRAEDLFEDAPCGYVSTRPDGTILKVNRTFETWTGFSRAELLAGRRFQDLLSAGGRIYHETHYAPLLEMQGSVREIAVELVRADGSRLPALINSVLRRDAQGRAQVVRTTVFDATDRRRYERELLGARRREQAIATELQRSLLSGTLAASPELDVGVAYRPAVSGLEVGGDWYDAFWLDDGETVALIVGDVVGRGIEAAATMGQLRSAVRALASTGLTPGPLLDALDQFSQRHSVGQMATLACVELAVASGELRYACAGHPPPMLLAPGAAPSLLWDGRSVPLDAFGRSGPRGEGTERLAAGSTLVLYTDGLIERRTRTIDDGMDRLMAEAARHPHARARALADGLARSFHDPEHSDDVCVLVARRQASE